VNALTAHAKNIRHVQAKDVQISTQGRNRFGVFGRTDRTNPFDSGWWRYRLPGLGELDWRTLIDALYEAGYDGTVAIEHEDPIWSGTEEKIMHGLRIAHRTLRPLIIC